MRQLLPKIGLATDGMQSKMLVRVTYKANGEINTKFSIFSSPSKSLFNWVNFGRETKY